MTERAWSTNSLRIWVHFMVSSLQWLPQELQQRFQTDLWSLGSHTSTQNWVIEICLYISVSICHIEGLFCDCHGHSKMDASEWMGFLERRLELCFKRVSHFSVQNQQELFLITVRQESLLSPSSWQHPSPDCRGSWGDCWDWGWTPSEHRGKSLFVPPGLPHMLLHPTSSKHGEMALNLN